MNINYVANGLGGQSMYLLYLASQKKIPATLALTADTGWENDCDMMDGTKTTACDFYHQYVKPFGVKWNIDTAFVRTLDKDKQEQLPIPLYLKNKVAAGHRKSMPVPMFGSDGGRLKQSCTDKWKISAMKQECRRRGAVTARSAQGIHYGERARRVKGKWITKEDGFDIYQTTKFDKEKGVDIPVKWLSHYYPLVDMQMNREEIRGELDRLGLPYLISSECAGCPHADPWRWLRRTDETIEDVAQIEDMYNGEFFFTDRRIPLRQAIAEMKDKAERQGNLFNESNFDCTGGWCGI